MGIFYNPKIVTDDLVLCLDAANKRSYPGTGTTWTDLAGSNDGTLINGPTFDATNGGSIVLDGTNDFVSIPLASLPTPNNSSNFTYEAVVKFDSLGWRTIFSQENGTGSGRIILGVHGTNSKLVTFFTSSLLQPSFDALSTNTIYHVALGVSGSNIYIGLNGVWDLISGSAFSSSGNGVINIGKEPNNGGGHVDGNVLAVRMHSRFLQDSELFENYRAIKGRYS
jgi:hypothetical protein